MIDMILCLILSWQCIPSEESGVVKSHDLQRPWMTYVGFEFSDYIVSIVMTASEAS